ncbi:hypothetical protein DNTS_035173, partial [Danionella cerebrum]
IVHAEETAELGVLRPLGGVLTGTGTAFVCLRVCERGRGWETTGAQARQSTSVCGPLSPRPRCQQNTHRPAIDKSTERPKHRALELPPPPPEEQEPEPRRCPRCESVKTHLLKMSWINGFLVARVDDRKSAWAERNGKKSKRKLGSSLCTPRYMSCLQDAEAMEPPPQPPHAQPTRSGGGVGGGNFGMRCGWQEDHYGKAVTGGGEGVGLKSVDLGFNERKGRKLDGSACDGSSEDTASGTGSVTAADCWQRVVRVFQSKKFQSRKLERLYQRYFFRLNQSSLTMLMGVLVIVCGVMLSFHCVHGTPHVLYASVLSIAMAMFLALMVVCNRNGFHQDYMWMVSYLVIGVLMVVQVLGVLMVAPRSASEGIWWSVFFIYIIYTLLPVRMRAAVLSGGVLSTIHLLTTWRINQEDEFLWKQRLLAPHT